MISPYTTFGAPPDGVAWAALAAAAGLYWVLHAHGPSLRRIRISPSLPPLALALTAALLSAGYVLFYLRGGPRIIDATSYFLEARAIARGYFAFPVPIPSGSFRGRFLLTNAARELSVIFPPGYPLVLALGFLVHAPLAVGPVLAALLVLCTYALARRISGRADTACVAGALSVLCAALRYHTADTMAHGLSALLLCASVFSALRSRARDAYMSGLACGFLVATRPVSGAVSVLVALGLLRQRPKRMIALALGLLPGLSLLLLYQHAATGSYWASTQLRYYALADGPPGCFRYGFGRGIGCLFEHGEYVRARLAHGYGLREAVSVTGRRLAIHCIDIANAAPLALLCPVGAYLGRRTRGVLPVFFACLALLFAYAPFYFEGSYPGGGARLFADILPLEHVLLAIALVKLEWTTVALPVSLLGFAVHASFSHRSLRERDGGSPMFDASLLDQRGIDHGLVFVDTDHGFNLGHVPGALDATREIIVARYRGDAHDQELWRLLGRPPSYRYVFTASQHPARHELRRYAPHDQPLRFEAEAEWPPLAISGGFSAPDFFPCASGGRGLRLQPTEGANPIGVSLELSMPDSRRHRLQVGWVKTAGPATTLSLSFGGATLSGSAPSGPPDCVIVELGEGAFPAGPVVVRLQASRPGLLDYIEATP